MKNVLKSSLSIFLAITIILSSAYVGISELDLNGLFEVKANAASSGTCGENLTWSLDDEGTLTISGTGDMYEYYDATPPYLYNGTITDVIIEDGVTSIGDKAFSSCSDLASIEIPNSVTSIGYEAFYYCTSLTSITIPDSVTSIGDNAFEECQSLVSIEIPDSVTNIGDSAFYECTSLTSVTLGNSVTSIGDNTFAYCDELASIEIPDSVTEIGTNAFYECDNLISITIPSSVKKISENAFKLCHPVDEDIAVDLESVYIGDIEAWCNIEFGNAYSNPLYYNEYYDLKLYINGELATDVVIPDGITCIPTYGFACKNICSIVIPDSVTSIGSGAFIGCENLVTIELPNSIQSMGYSVFEDCLSLTSITIPDGVPSIGSFSFDNCTSLTSITIPKSVTSIGSYAFRECLSLRNTYITDIASWCNIEFGNDTANPLSYTNNLYLDGELVKELVIPEGVTSIGDYAFYNFYKLTSVTIPDSVTSIGEHAFEYCTSLTSVTIGNSVTSMGDKSFYGCSKLEAINVAPENGCFSSIDGVLYDKNQTNIILYPKNKNDSVFTIPDSVTSFAENSFGYNDNIQTIVFGTGLTRVPSDIFSSMDGLRNIVVPLNIKSFLYGAFSWCYDITTVFYEGTQEQWQNVTIAANNGSLSDSDICVHYNVDIENWENHYGEPVTKQEPSCTESGLYTYICPCGYEKTEELSRLPHNYSDEWTIDSKATCEYSGSKSRHCLTCDSRTDVTTIPATGVHTPGEWCIEYNATCTREGSKYKRCIDCLEILERETIPNAEHTPSPWYLEKGATVNSAGSKYKMCIDCWEVLEKEPIPQLKCSKPKLKTISNTANGVKVTWGSVNGADSYRVYRKTSKSDWKYLGSTSKTGYTDKTAKSGTKYYYAVRARNEAGNSSLSSSLSKLYLADPTLKTPSSSKTGIKLTWNKISGAEGYMVYRKTGTGSYTKIATVKGSTKVTYTDKSAKKGKKYTYKVKAYKSKTYSAYSNTKTITDKY